ncbi:MAG: hypothetical protein AMS24_00385 [Chlamydiae bacterium SM23_39]|nr:MAG: hypothetical protein AMS24_00385 [Chlamydiae bacterium SM23_39]
MLNSLYDLGGNLITSSVKDWLGHHPHDNVVKVQGIDLLIREVALDTFGHNIQLTVVGSPQQKLNGFVTSNTGSSSKKARGKCIKAIEYMVKQTYKN